MSRTGVEEKPPWQSVPQGVRDAVDSRLGSPVSRASRVWGGYAPTPTYRLRLTDGRRAFFKAINPDSNPFMAAAFANERRFYGELAPQIPDWCPALLGSFSTDGWSVLLLEDLGPKSAPPWNDAIARRMMSGLAGFHLSTRGLALPAWVERQSDFIAGNGCSWRWLEDTSEVRNAAGVASTAAAEMESWLRSEGPRLRRIAGRLLDPSLETTLLHVDVRSDNLRWRKGHLYLLDWPHIAAGTPELDAALFAQSIAAEAGPLPEALLPSYERVLKLDAMLMDAAIAAAVGFFAKEAWQPEIPGLPRLRRFQRRQLRATVAWAVRRIGVAEAAWVKSIPESEPALPF